MHARQRVVLDVLNASEQNHGPKQKHNDGDYGAEQYNKPRLSDDVVRVVPINWESIGEEKHLNFMLMVIYVTSLTLYNLDPTSLCWDPA